MAREKILGMPASTFRQLEQQPCGRCNAPGPNHPQRDREVLCHTCITRISADIDRQRAEQRANAPRCEGCNRRPATRDLLCTDRRFPICGTCRGKVNRKIRALALFGPPRATTADVLTVLGSTSARAATSATQTVRRP